ncbi:MAG: Gfo/Idh/MocA family protein [Chloroflexota bacterium]
MKVCIIGNRGHLNYAFAGLPVLPDVEVAAISAGTAEDDPASLQALCQKLGHAPQVYEDWKVMLARVRPQIAVVCGPFELHAAMSQAAIEQGIHVFCEKPVALSLDELARLQAAYTQADVHFAAMMGMRYEAPFYTAWQQVRAGAVGEIRLLNAQKSYRLGTRPAYYSHRETYGGTIPWVGSHAIDLIHWFSGRDFLSVTASHSRTANGGQGDLETAALCQFQMAGEVIASASIDYFRPANAPSHGDDRLRVVGDRGVIEVRGGQVYLINERQPGEVTLPLLGEQQIFCDFVARVAGNSATLLSAADAFIVTRVCLLARQSADEGRAMSIP